MKKIPLITFTILAGLTARAEGGPHFDKGGIMLLGFIAVATVIIVLCLISALILKLLQYLLEVKKYFLLVFLGCLAGSIAGVAIISSLGEQYRRFTIFFLVVMPLIGSLIGFAISPVNTKK